MSQVSILCLIPTESASLETKAAVINTTWATRCDFLQFVSDKEDPSNTLPVMLINSTGRASLWGKTKTMFSMLNESLAYDWVLKADTDTYIIMENLKNLLSHYNCSKPLLAGSMYICRSNTRECNDFDGDKNTDEVYMTGGAGYVLSREAVARFVSGHGDASKCRPGDEGPEDVEMSRCLQRLGVNFLDTRDKYGRNRFFHFSGEDALSLSEQVYRPDLSWILNYGIIPLGPDADCCSNTAISFHHLSLDQIKLMEYMLYSLKAAEPEDDDLNTPVEESLLPSKLVEHSDILEIVLNIRNTSLRRSILMKQDLIDYSRAAQILQNETRQVQNFTPGDQVFLRMDIAMNLSLGVFTIQQVSYDSKSNISWLFLNNGNGNLCKIENSKVILKVNDEEEDIPDENDTLEDYSHDEENSEEAEYISVKKEVFSKVTESSSSKSLVFVEVFSFCV